jgi:hypothetical protein
MKSENIVKSGAYLTLRTLICIVFLAKSALAEDHKVQTPVTKELQPHQLVSDFKFGGDARLNGRWRCEKVFFTLAPKPQLSQRAPSKQDCSAFKAGLSHSSDSNSWDVKIINMKLMVVSCNMHTAFIHASHGQLKASLWNSTRRLCSDGSDAMAFQFKKIRHYFRVKERLYFFDGEGNIMFSFILIDALP